MVLFTRCFVIVLVIDLDFLIPITGVNKNLCASQCDSRHSSFWGLVCWLYNIHAEYFVGFRLPEFTRFSSSAVQGGVERAHIWCSLCNGVFGHVNAAQTSIPYFLKFGKRVQTFMTDFVVLCSNTNVTFPVCFKVIVVGAVYLFVSVHLFIWRLFLLVLYGFNGFYVSFILLLPLLACDDYGLAQGENKFR